MFLRKFQGYIRPGDLCQNCARTVIPHPAGNQAVVGLKRMRSCAFSDLHGTNSVVIWQPFHSDAATQG